MGEGWICEGGRGVIRCIGGGSGRKEVWDG